MKLVYLPANQAWAFVFGYALLRLHPQSGNNAPYPLFFDTEEDAKATAAAFGLLVGADGTVE